MQGCNILSTLHGLLNFRPLSLLVVGIEDPWVFSGQLWQLLPESRFPWRVPQHEDMLRIDVFDTQRVIKAILPSVSRHAKKNSFVLNSLIVSRNFAAFSNSNFFAASRISLSSLPM